MITSDMHHPAMYMYINFQQNQASRSVKTVHTNPFTNNHKLHNLQLAIRISRNHSFQTWITQFSGSKPILRSIDSADLLEPRSKVISTDDGHNRRR